MRQKIPLAMKSERSAEIESVLAALGPVKSTDEILRMGHGAEHNRSQSFGCFVTVENPSDSKARVSSGEFSVESPALMQLWDEVGIWSHQAFPFRHSAYSPSSLMPAIDYSLWIRDCLIKGEIGAVIELLSFLKPRYPEWDNLVDMILSVPLLTGDNPMFEAELRGVMLLCHRAGEPDLATLWPSYWASVISVYSSEEAFSVTLRGLPPSFRIMVLESWKRSNNRHWLSVPYDLWYGDRRFGCRGEWNKHYADQLGLYTSPDLDTPLPQFITKHMIAAAALRHGVIVDGSMKKSEMVDVVRKAPAILTDLWSQCSEPLVIWNKSQKLAVERWANNHESCLALASKMIAEVSGILRSSLSA